MSNSVNASAQQTSVADRLQQELELLLGRAVDLVSRRAIENSANWIRRREILRTAQPFYVA